MLIFVHIAHKKLENATGANSSAVCKVLISLDLYYLTMSFDELLLDIATYDAIASLPILLKKVETPPLIASTPVSSYNVNATSAYNDTSPTIVSSAAFLHAMQNVDQLETIVKAYKARTQHTQIQWIPLFDSLGWVLNKRERKLIATKYYAFVRSSTKANNSLQVVSQKYRCDSCGLINKTNTKLKIHIMRNHTRIKNHKCNICEKKFFLPTAL